MESFPIIGSKDNNKGYLLPSQSEGQTKGEAQGTLRIEQQTSGRVRTSFMDPNKTMHMSLRRKVL